MSALSAGLRGSTEFSTKPGPGLPMPRSLCASICVTSNGTESCPAAINSCQNCSAPSCVSKTLPGIFLSVFSPQFFSKNSLTFSACHGSCPAASGRAPAGAGSQQSARKNQDQCQALSFVYLPVSLLLKAVCFCAFGLGTVLNSMRKPRR